MDVELVDPTAIALDAIWQDWERLFAADDLATPFQAAGWARAWLEQWDPQAEPWLLRVRDGDRVAGIAPLALQRRRGLRLLTTVGKEPGDYWDILAAPEDRVRVARAAGSHLARLAGRWDAGILSCQPPESKTLEQFASTGLRFLTRPPVASPALALPDTFDEYLSTLPSSHRKSLRRHLRRLDSGEVGLDVVKPAGVEEVMERWRELRSLQWRALGKQITAQHEEDRFHNFMLAAVGGLLDAGLAVVWQLSVDARVVAVYVNFADANNFYWYLGGFDPDYRRLGLGKIAIGASIRESIETGRRRYDFTRGADTYKYWYGAVDRPLASVVLGHGGVRSRAALTGARTILRYRARATPLESA